MFLSTCLAVGLASAATGCIPHLIKPFQIRRLPRQCRETGSLVLSYDDGPGVSLSPQILERLESRGARATFFLLGMRAHQHPEIVEQVVAAGHEVACHSQSHRHAWKSWPAAAIADISDGYESLRQWVPPDAPFRPPYGKLTLLTWLVLRRRGASLAWWTADSGDTHAVLPSRESVVERVRRDHGGVVLLHDFDRTGPTTTERAEFVLKTTTLLLQLAASEGLTVRTFGELLRMSHDPYATDLLTTGERSHA